MITVSALLTKQTEALSFYLITKNNRNSSTLILRKTALFLLLFPTVRGIMPLGRYTYYILCRVCRPNPVNRRSPDMPTVTKINRDNLRQRRHDMGFREDLPTVKPATTARPAPQPRPLGAKPRVNRIEAAAPEQKKLRVAAYCRVSTMMESQQTSIDNQEQHYRSYIIANPEWELADVYVDRGISGTEAESREALQGCLMTLETAKSTTS